MLWIFVIVVLAEVGLATASGMTEPERVIANFAAFTVQASSGVNGTVTPASCSYYNSGTVVSIAATADAGFQFNNWRDRARFEVEFDLQRFPYCPCCHRHGLINSGCPALTRTLTAAFFYACYCANSHRQFQTVV
jgi:hypothetical protein